MMAEVKYSVKRSRDKVKELTQKVKSKHIKMKNNREKIKKIKTSIQYLTNKHYGKQKTERRGVNHLYKQFFFYNWLTGAFEVLNE